MTLTLTPIYAGILTLIYIALSIRVIAGRRAAKARIGDGGDILLQRRLRVHANFAEYIPLALLLMLGLDG